MRAQMRMPWKGEKIVTDVLTTLAALVSGYLLGSLNTAVVVGKIHGKDISRHGSGNAGRTNTLRVLGKSAAALVLAGDVLKGIAACLVGVQLGVQVQSGGAADSLGLLAAGAGAVVGHNWPVWFGFRGGKGALTGAAVLFMLDWDMALVCLGAFAIVVASTRYVSLGTICGTVLFAALSFMPVWGHTVYFTLFAVVMALVVVLRHRGNVQRLLAGTESKLAF